MTEKPWETENGPGTPPNPESALDALKKEADELGVQYAANIGASTLAARIDEHKQANSTPPAPPAPPTPPTPPAPPAPNPDEDKPEPTVVTQPDPGGDINAQKCEEKVSKADRKATKASINWDNQAPLEVINMVSGGMSMADAKEKYTEAMEIRAVREAIRRGEEAEAEE